MEWVETTGRTVEEAKDRALDQLGVDEVDAEFEIVEEPRPGLFGRVRGEARVRARVRPTRPRPKVERRERRKRGSETTASASAPAANGGDETEAAGEPAYAVADGPPDEKAAAPRRRSRRAPEPAPGTLDAGAGQAPAETLSPTTRGNGESPKAARSDAPVRTGDDDDSAGPDAVAPLAASFLSGLAEAFGVEATTITEIDGDELEVRLDGADLGLMIGPRGQTLLAIQDLARTVSQRGIPDHGRLRIDVGGYRQRRREALARFTTDVARQVLEGGSPRMLEPMVAADRKVVHDTAATIEGVQTRSEGEEPNRRVVILPAE